MIGMTGKRRDSIHEDFFRQEEVERSSDRTFGLVFAAFFLLLAFVPWLRGHAVRPWAAGIATVLVVVSLAAPHVLQPFNKSWTKFAIVLREITNPLVMGLLFYSTIAPIGVLMRLLRHDALHSQWDREASTYWIERTPPGPKADAMRDQF